MEWGQSTKEWVNPSRATTPHSPHWVVRGFLLGPIQDHNKCSPPPLLIHITRASVSHHWFTSRECFPPLIHITSGRVSYPRTIGHHNPITYLRMCRVKAEGRSTLAIWGGQQGIILGTYNNNQRLHIFKLGGGYQIALPHVTQQMGKT
jgi:hypothetical protein